MASGTARGWGCTGQGLSILYETPTFVEYTHLSASSTPPSCSTRGRENDRLTAAERTGDGPIDCQIDDGNDVAQTGGPIHGACRDGCRQGWLTGGAESPQRTQPPRRYRDPSENRMIPRAAHQPHQPWSRHVRCTDTKPLTREAEEVCPASFLAGQTLHVVELGGFEPPTFSLRTRRATNCAIAPGAGLILASSPDVLASSVAVSPPTAPEPRYDRDEDHRPPYSPAARRPSRMASRSMGWKSSSSSSSTGAGM